MATNFATNTVGQIGLNVLFNPLEFRGIYSATSNNMKLVHWPLMGAFGTVRRGLGRAAASPSSSSLYQM